MDYFAGCDLHSNNTVIGIIDEEGRRIYQSRIKNDLRLVRDELEPFQDKIKGVVVESTFNWFWLVDGLKEAGLKLHLANPSAIKLYEGPKHSDDCHDAFYLADLLSLGILPEGYIYRRLGCKISSVKIHKLKEKDVDDLFDDPHVVLASKSHLSVIGFLSSRIEAIEQEALRVMRPLSELGKFKTVYGAGDVLALTIM
jgi:transposase